MTESPADPLAQALQALAVKERSVAEMGDWLRERQVSEEDVEAVVSYLIEIGSLDDARFAARFAEDKRHLAGWGSERIRDALLARGVGAADVEGAVDAEEGADELERAVSALRDRGIDLADDRERGRAFGFLTRRGFTADAAYEAIRRAGDGPDLA
jgi:regulatory protein